MLYIKFSVKIVMHRTEDKQKEIKNEIKQTYEIILN